MSKAAPLVPFFLHLTCKIRIKDAFASAAVTGFEPVECITV